MKRFSCLSVVFMVIAFCPGLLAIAPVAGGNICHGSKTFTYTGSVQTFKVPCNTKITIAVYGAAGGKADCCSYGYGGSATGTLTVGRNKVLYINVGGLGSLNDSLSGFSGGGGFNGGGNGGINGYGGGGASDVRVGSNSHRRVVLVGAGGGGTSVNAGSTDRGRGGGGGGLNGGNGGNTRHGESRDCATFSTGGTGGTQTGAGAGGVYEHYFDSGQDGLPGTLGTGGSGAGNYSGGGGGGYYGGGGGGHTDCSDFGAGGGGGSSYIGGVSGGSTMAGVNSPEGKYGGNGYVIITW